MKKQIKKKSETPEEREARLKNPIGAADLEIALGALKPQTMEEKLQILSLLYGGG